MRHFNGECAVVHPSALASGPVVQVAAMTCSVCNQDKPITLEYGVKWGRDWVRYRICVPCELKERGSAEHRSGHTKTNDQGDVNR